MRICTGGHDPKGYDDGEEAGKVEDQDDTFDKRQLDRQRCIEDDGECDGGNRQEGSMPVVPHIVGNIEGNQALDNGANHEAHTGQVDLPSNSREPA